MLRTGRRLRGLQWRTSPEHPPYWFMTVYTTFGSCAIYVHLGDPWCWSLAVRSPSKLVSRKEAKVDKVDE